MFQLHFLSKVGRAVAQVHRAQLHSGERVVVKVQRPGLARLFEIDLAQLRKLAEQLDAQEEGRDFTGIYAECAAILYQEIDYIAEGRNADRWRHLPPFLLLLHPQQLHAGFTIH